jgi:hypothetical protein
MRGQLERYGRGYILVQQSLQYSWPRKGVMIHGDGGKEKNEGEKPITGHSLVDQTRE